MYNKRNTVRWGTYDYMLSSIYSVRHLSYDFIYYRWEQNKFVIK
jgi:hypothetical protein